MNLKNKSILLISPECWEHIFVSKHHYANHLAKRGNKVFFLNPPTKRKQILETGYKNVWQLDYSGFPKGLRFFPSFLQKFFIYWAFLQLQRLCSTEFDIVWSFDNSVFYDFSALPQNVLKISHIVDLNQNFQTEIASSTADICFGLIRPIVERSNRFNKHSYLIPHGVQRFPLKKNGSKKLPGINKIKAIYMGNLGMRYVDWEILWQTACKINNVDFIFIGPNLAKASNPFVNRLVELENTYFVGRVSSVEVPTYLDRADILLLAYQPKYSEEYASPHKMMEYLASGKMIVATFMAEYTELCKMGMFVMSEDNCRFPLLFKSVVKDLDLWNSARKTQMRMNFSIENTYEKQLEKIEKLLLKI